MKKILLLLLTLLLFSCNEDTVDITDTDGDGMSDSKELEFFNPEVDSSLFNPNISDLPILDINIYDVPQLSINYIRTNTTSTSQSISSEKSEERTMTLGGNAGFSTTISGGVTAGLFGAGSEVRIDTSVTAHVEINGEMSENIRKSIRESRKKVNKGTLTAKEAKISVPVFIKNIGNIPVSIKDLTLTAYSINMYDEMRMIGSLKAENFKDIYLQPGNDPVIINFQNGNLYPSRMEEIMYFSKRIVVVPASYDMNIILNDEVVGYHEAYSAVKAKTARVHFKNGIYDINNQKFNDVYDIAASSLTEIFDVLNMNYIIKDGWVSSLNDQRGHNILTGGEWEIRHIGIRNRKEFENIYNSNNPVLDAEVRPGDDVFIYRTEVGEEERENYSISHQSIKGFKDYGEIDQNIENINKEVKLERNSERGVYQEIYLDISPQRRLEIITHDNILFEFNSLADVGNNTYAEADPNAEETEYVRSYDRSPKRIFINGKEIEDINFTPSEMAYDPGILELDLDELGFSGDEKIETIDFYFIGGANPSILPYTPRPTEEGAKAKWYNLPHVETYIFGK